MLPAKTARTRSVGTKLTEEEYGRLGGKGVGKRGQPELSDFPEKLASAEALPGICLAVNGASSPASLAM